MEQLQMRCSFCDREFPEGNNLYEHLRNIHKIKLSCPEDNCNERFLNYEYLRQHLSYQHGVSVDYEDLTFKSREDFEKWKEQIQKKTNTFYTMYKGVKFLSGGRRKQMFNCNGFLSNKACPARIETVFQNDVEETPISVKFWKTHCGHTGRSKQVPFNELGDGRIECQVCKMIFFLKHHFKGHLCNVNVKTGTTITDEDRTIPCPECDDRMFSSVSNLKKHSYYHTNKTTLTCPKCKKKFLKKKILAEHLLTHRDDGPFLCKMCKKLFLKTETLKKHIMKAHSYQKLLYKCAQCSRIFVRKKALMAHVQIKHNLRVDQPVTKVCSRGDFGDHLIEVTETKISLQDTTSTEDDESLTENAENPLVKLENELKDEYCDVVQNPSEEDTKDFYIKEELVEF